MWPASPISSRRGGLCIDLGEELVGNGAGTVEVGERFPDDTSSQFPGQSEDILAKFGLGKDSVRFKLHRGCGDKFLTHPVPLHTHFSKDRRAFLMGSLTDLRGFVPGGTQFSLVLGMNALRLESGFLSAFQRALSDALALGEGLLNSGKQDLGHDGEDCSEADQADYELYQIRFQGSHCLIITARS